MKPGDLAINQAAGRVGVGAGCLGRVSQRGGRGDGGWMLDLELAIWWRGGGESPLGMRPFLLQNDRLIFFLFRDNFLKF